MIDAMVGLKIFACAIAVLLGVMACSSQQSNSEDVIATGVKNIRHSESTIYTGGQPTREQLAALAEAGVRHIVNLRPASELDWDEAAYVQSLGMHYHNLPVAGADDLSASNAEAFSTLLAGFGEQPVLVHCASGNRVGALAAIAASQQGAEAEQALEKGRRWGMTRLESTVRERLTTQ